MTVTLWDRPALAPSFRRYDGMQVAELVKLRNPDVVRWHVMNKGWQLSEAAKAAHKQQGKKQKV